MSDARSTGLVLMALATAAFVGSTAEMLPAVTFFPALFLFLLGAFKFVRSNGRAMAEAERRIERRLRPEIRENRRAAAHAERLAARRGSALTSINAEEAAAAEAAARLASGIGPGAADDARAIELDVPASELVVTPDVSFPVEIQSGDALAEQLEKLSRLLAQGVLTEEEYAVAKAKLLS